MIRCCCRQPLLHLCNLHMECIQHFCLWPACLSEQLAAAARTYSRNATSTCLSRVCSEPWTPSRTWCHTCTRRLARQLLQRLSEQ
jgi:hypothetical protein